MATVIPKQPKKGRDQITIRLERDVLQTLEHYCRYLESSRDYVIHQCLTFIFRKGRPFQEWLTAAGIIQSSTMKGGTSEPPPLKVANSKAKSAASQGLLTISE